MSENKDKMKVFERGKMLVAAKSEEVRKKRNKRIAARRTKRGSNIFEREKNPGVVIQMLNALFGFGPHK